jgi:uncharacterized protein (TIGR02145 family)
MKKNRIIHWSLIVSVGFLLIFTFSCETENNEPTKKLPILTPSNALNITQTTATLFGSVNANGNSTIVTFEYGIDTSYGQTITASQSPVNGSITTNVSVNISELIASTLYHFRLVGINSIGTVVSEDLTFTTASLPLPTASTNSATNIAPTSATLNGIVNANGTSTTVIFEFGTTTDYGQTATAIQSPVTGNTATSVSANIVGLTEFTKYHFRIVGTSSAGTSEGSDLTFTTSGLVTDIDGNIYNTILIGTQVWMVENLNTTKYRNGVNIPNITDNLAWDNLNSGAYCDYNNDPSNSNNYGRLYNWFAVVDTRNICPTGWHVPTDADWTTLVNYLGGSSVAGSKLKEIGSTHWNAYNTGATNSSGFTALPGGYRNYDGLFNSINNLGYWWSTTKNQYDLVWARSMSGSQSSVSRYDYIDRNGHSVRCIKD